MKKWMRKWLEGPYTNGEEIQKLLDDAENAVKEVQDLKELLAGMHSVLAEQQRRFDALCDALGVVVVSDFTKGTPAELIISVNENGVLGKSNERFLQAVEVQRLSLVNQLLTVYQKGKERNEQSI